MDLVGTILAVSGRKSRDGSKDMWDVAFSDGNTYTTFEGKDAALAAGLVNQPNQTIQVEMKGQYKNLVGFGPAGSAAVPGTALPSGTPVAPPPTTDTPTERRMGFYAALKNAQYLVSNLMQGAGPEAIPEAETHIKRLTAIFLAGAKAAEQGQVMVAEATPNGVAAAVNAEAGTEVVQTGRATPAW